MSDEVGTRSNNYAPLLNFMKIYRCLRDGGSGTAELGLRAATKFNQWTELYRGLLDRWKLFHERCRFGMSSRFPNTIISFVHHLVITDIDRRKIASRLNNTAAVTVPSSPFTRVPTSPTPNVPALSAGGAAIEREYNSGLAIPPQVYVRCNFCGHAITHHGLLIPGLGMVGKTPGAGGPPRSGASPMTGMPGAPTDGMMGSGYSTPSNGMAMPGGGVGASMAGAQRVKPIACPSCRKRRLLFLCVVKDFKSFLIFFVNL
jgi:DNA-directed RNA polymerase subunit RPC12/RpoP